MTDQQTRNVMLRLPVDVYERLLLHATARTIPVAILARMLVVLGMDELEKHDDMPRHSA